MNTQLLNILLADDDIDDCTFFKTALEQLPLTTNMTVVSNGVHLMNYLNENVENLPDILFLDLNMPLKNGFECLSEIKENEKLKNLTVIIFSTSYPTDKEYQLKMINTLLDIGAHVYIRKPGDFSQLKKIIEYALLMATEKIDSNNPIKYILNA